MSGEKPLSSRERRFCELVAIGELAHGRCYEQAGYKARGATADAEASKTLRKPKIEAHLATIRNKAAAKCEMTRDDAVEMLVKVLKSKPSDASLENPLCELKMSKIGPFAAFPDKSQSLARLAKMLGWDEPEKHQLDVEIIIGGNAESHNQD